MPVIILLFPSIACMTTHCAYEQKERCDLLEQVFEPYVFETLESRKTTVMSNVYETSDILNGFYAMSRQAQHDDSFSEYFFV